MKNLIACVGLLSIMSSTALAQRAPFSTISNQNIFGNSYNLDIFRVATDLPTGTGARLEPEGMVFHNGVLYVSGDGTGTETNGYLARYAGGDLRFSPTAAGPFSSSNAAGTTGRFGPEGITVNTSGQGYGSFSGSTPNLVGVDNVTGGVGRQLAVMNLSSTTVQNQVNGFVNADDITFVPGPVGGADRFAIIDGTAAIPAVAFYTTAAMPTVIGTGFNLPLGAKGLMFLSAADAALFSPLATDDALLVASSPDGVATSNRLSLYLLNGTLLGESALPTGLGAALLGNIEALAFDSATRRLFIGDETGANSQIAVLTIPSPSGLAMVALIVAMAARRRRN